MVVTFQIPRMKKNPELLVPFVKAIKNFFWEITKAVKYKQTVAKLLSSLQDMGTNMSIKLHFQYSHLDCFPKNFENLSNDQ